MHRSSKYIISTIDEGDSEESENENESPSSDETTESEVDYSTSDLESKLSKSDEFINEKTFLYSESVDKISKDDLLILDNYAFSITELKEYGERSIDTFFKNPHEDAPAFSDEAIKILEEHPQLKAYAIQHKNKMSLQKTGISDDTVNAVIEMLQEINNLKGIEGTVDPRIKFLEYESKLPNTEQKKLNEYSIKIACHSRAKSFFSNQEAKNALVNLKFSAFDKKPTTSSTNQERVLSFADAIIGGNQAAPCVRTLQIFLWQFVLNFKPNVKIPDEVKTMADMDKYLLGNPVEELKSTKINKL